MIFTEVIIKYISFILMKTTWYLRALARSVWNCRKNYETGNSRGYLNVIQENGERILRRNAGNEVFHILFITL